MTARTQPVFVHSLGRIAAAALLGGLVAGALDIFNAAYIYSTQPAVILRAIASGVLGSESFEGGTMSAALGLGLQWFISVCSALVYIAAGRRIPILLREPLLFGPIFGAGVFCMMHFLIVPLSKANSALPPPIPFSKDFVANVLFGLIIAVAAKWVLRRRDT